VKHALIAALFVVTALVGCSSDDGGETAAPAVEVNLVNTHCPIMGHEVTDDGGRTDYNGGTVGFCCPGCVDSFNELDADAKEDALATKGKGIIEEDEGHEHGDGHDHAEEDGHEHTEDEQVNQPEANAGDNEEE